MSDRKKKNLFIKIHFTFLNNIYTEERQRPKNLSKYIIGVSICIIKTTAFY